MITQSLDIIPFSSIAIIWYGDFWKLLVQIITASSQNVRVGVISRSPNDYGISWESLSEFEVVVSCVPLSLGAETYDKIKKFAREDVLIRDICSIKEQPVSRLDQSGLQSYIATHPMFGPYSYAKKWSSLEGLRLVVTWSTCSDSLLSSRTRRFESLWLVLIFMSHAQHDQYLAKTLFLTHYVAQIVHESWFDRTEIDTVSFGFLMDAVESVKHDKALFLDIWAYNPYCKKIIWEFVKAQQEIHKLLWL